MIDLSKTIIAKSDQMNAADLVGCPKIIKVTRVTLVNNPQQPVIINYEDDNKRPYKPCKGMRRGLILAWGENGEDYVGRSMQVFCNPKVTYGPDEVGGIQISAVSHINHPIKFNLLVHRKQVPHRFEVLKTEEDIANQNELTPESFEDWKIKMDDAENMAELSKIASEIKEANYNAEGSKQLRDYYKESTERLR